MLAEICGLHMCNGGKYVGLICATVGRPEKVGLLCDAKLCNGAVRRRGGFVREMHISRSNGALI